MEHHTDADCTEFARLSRRGLFRGALAATAGVTSVAHGSAFMQTAYAATRSAPAVLVVLSMRGACDGLSLVVPHADPVYYRARPVTAVPAARLLARNGMFGLHPALAPLMPMWNAGRLAAVHAVGLPAPNRSHFAAMELVEDADPGSAARVGWLNRLIGRDGLAHPLQGVQLGDSLPPTSLYGPQPVLAAQDLGTLSLAGDGPSLPLGWRAQSLHTLWDSAPGALGRGARAAFQAVADSGPARAVSTAPANGAVYPNDDLGKALKEAARVIRGDVGAEVITVDHGSWDHHTSLGNLEWGLMRDMAATFAKSIAAFFQDLGTLGAKVTLVTISEFGRRVKENANVGLDHGHGTVMFLAGAGVRGGYHGRFPSLSGTVDADLTVTTDYRSVLSEVVRTRFGASSATVFPGFTPSRVGAMLGT